MMAEHHRVPGIVRAILLSHWHGSLSTLNKQEAFRTCVFASWNGGISFGGHAGYRNFFVKATYLTASSPEEFHSSEWLSLNHLSAEASVWHAIAVNHPSGYNLKCKSSYFITASESLVVKITTEGWFCVIKMGRKKTQSQKTGR